ncbi:MAG: hypothetical protein ABSG13_09295 [Bryobacteraceae bacterium]|jgi:hypothetical protein
MTAYERVKERFRFLKALYDRVGDDITTGHHFTWIADDINLNHPAAARFAQLLASDHLVSLTNEGNLRITHTGIKEIEAALTKPESPTEHFPAYVVNIQNMTNSTIQQGSHHSSATIVAQPGEIESLKQLLASIKEEQDKLQLSADIRAEMDSEIQTVESQLSSPRPKSVIVKESLRTLRTILENAGAALLAAAIQKHLGS